MHWTLQTYKKKSNICTPTSRNSFHHVIEEIQCHLINISCNRERDPASRCKQRYKYIMVTKTITKDCFSTYCWLSPLQSKKATERAGVLEIVSEERSALYYLNTDNGIEFINELATVLCNSEQF